MSEVRSHCPEQNQTLTQYLDSMSLEELRNLTKHWLVDDKHKVVGCLHFKVGTSTLDVIFCNNSVPVPYKPNTHMYWEKWKKCLPQNGVYYLGDSDRYTKQEIIVRINTYYKFMVVRHPLDRLFSMWKDKMADWNVWYRHYLGAPILAAYRKHLPESIIKEGKGVLFEELVQYVLDGHKDVHWKGPYNDQCIPCLVDYDAIIKLETFAHDIIPFINDKLEGRSLDIKENSHSGTSWDANYHKYIPGYAKVTEKQVSGLVEKYALDLSQFGYQYEFKNGRMNISCTSSQGCC